LIAGGGLYSRLHAAQNDVAGRRKKSSGRHSQ
jgi:hypothetical protein